MKHLIKECIQCGTRYTYQASGWSCCDNYNHEDYCPDCWELVSKVLDRIPKKFKYKLVGTDEVTLAQLLRWEHKNTSKLYARRVFPGAYDQITGDYQNVRIIKGQDKYEGIKFCLAEWELSPEYIITKEVFWDINKNKSVDGEYYCEANVLLNPRKKYPPKKAKNEQEIKIIPLAKPVGIYHALKFSYDNMMLNTADEIGTNQIAIETGYNESKQTLDSLSEDEFDDVRQIIYEKYNPSHRPMNKNGTFKRWPQLYLQCEKIYCRKELNRFNYVIRNGNRFSKLLATARVAKARYSWYKQYYQTFKYNA